MRDVAAGIAKLVKPEQFLNASDSIAEIPPDNVTLDKLPHPVKQFAGIAVEASTVTLVIPEQSANALVPMLTTLAGIVTLVKFAQPANADTPILVTLSGIDTLVMLVFWNAPSPMLVTSPGIVMAFSVPMY